MDGKLSMRDPEKAKAQREELKKYIETLKRNGECTSCHLKDHRVLEFHHRNPSEKKFSIVQAVHNRYSLNTLKEEIKKCDLVCANCHRIIHYEDDKECNQYADN